MTTEPPNVLPLAKTAFAEMILSTTMGGQSHLACPPTRNTKPHNRMSPDTKLHTKTFTEIRRVFHVLCSLPRGLGADFGYGPKPKLSETEIRHSETQYRPKPRCTPSATRPRPSKKKRKIMEILEKNREISE
jgi:hypothetical protein